MTASTAILLPTVVALFPHVVSDHDAFGDRVVKASRLQGSQPRRKSVAGIASSALPASDGTPDGIAGLACGADKINSDFVAADTNASDALRLLAAANTNCQALRET